MVSDGEAIELNVCHIHASWYVHGCKVIQEYHVTTLVYLQKR